MQLTDKDCDQIFNHAMYLAEHGHFAGKLDVLQIADILEKAHIEKIERELATDQLIDYNDEIVSIEPMGEMDTIDISVSGDNLFLCNGILTKNSMGLVHSLDLYLALIRTEELDALGQLMIKQLKNRYGDPTYYRKFVVGMDRSRMKLYNLEDDAQQNLSGAGVKDVPAFDNTKTGKSIASGGHGGAKKKPDPWDEFAYDE